MNFEDLNPDMPEEEERIPEESGNRAFLIVAGVLGAIALLALLLIAAYALVLRPRQVEARAAQQATVDFQNTQVAAIIAQTSTAAAFAAQITPTPTATLTPIPVTPTNTAVLVIPTTAAPTTDPRTATVAALLTQAAVATRTVVVTPTALPTTGFADEVGLPMMLGLAALLVFIIFLARRLRSSIGS